jgi:hypothetical protein
VQVCGLTGKAGRRRSAGMEEKRYRESRLCRLLGNLIIYQLVLRLDVDGPKTPGKLAKQIDRHPKQDRRDEIALWERRSERSVALAPKLEERTRQIAQQGIQALDAAHLASAEAGGAEVMLTCDDVILRRGSRLGLALRVLNPVAYLSEVEAHG